MFIKAPFQATVTAQQGYAKAFPAPEDSDIVVKPNLAFNDLILPR